MPDAPHPMRPDPRLAALHRLARQAAAQLDMDLAIRFWDGSVAMLGPRWSGDVAVAITTPSALSRLLRRPRLTTVVELVAEGGILIEGGTLLDLAARRAAGKGMRGLARRLAKGARA